MNGLELIVRHAFPPNKLGYCGKWNYQELFLNYIKTKQKELEIIQALETFTVLDSYLQKIALDNSLKKFDFEVAESYWIGNSITQKNVKCSELKEIVFDRFTKEHYISKEIALELCNFLPETIPLHHSFHVLLFSKRGKSALIEKADSCKISFGKIIEMKEKELIVDYFPLIVKDESTELALGELTTKTISHSFNDFLAIGDLISFHWNEYCMKLSKEQFKQLKEFTIKSIKLFNEIINKF